MYYIIVVVYQLLGAKASTTKTVTKFTKVIGIVASHSIYSRTLSFEKFSPATHLRAPLEILKRSPYSGFT